MSALRFTKPDAFTTGIVSGIFAGAVEPSDPKCNLNGSATFSWLLRFDLGAGTIKTGASKPSLNPAGPYAFIDQTITLGGTPFHIQPVTVAAPLAGGCSFGSDKADVFLPIYLDAAGTSMVLLPMRALRFLDGELSPDHGCIGRYNAAGLDPTNVCLPDIKNPAFIPGGKVEAFIGLEDADEVVISSLNQTLCVLLSQDATTYGTKSSTGVTVCKRDAAGQILFEGDWCAASNQAASAGCADAMRVQASFAAQGVVIQ